MKIEKSSADCAARNLAVKSEIYLGLSEPWEPSDNILKQEAKVEAERKAGVQLFQGVLGMFQAIYAALPVNVREIYKEPKTAADIEKEYCGYRMNVAAKIDGFIHDNVNIESVTSGGYSSHHQYWKLVVGGYGDKKWCKLGEQFTISEKQLKKAVECIVERFNMNVADAGRRVEQDQASKRRAAFVAAEPDFCRTFDLSTYSDKFHVAVDGKVTIGWETFTVDQWRQIAILRNAQKAAMSALKESFKPAK